MSLITYDFLKDPAPFLELIRKAQPFLDVRAEVEFQEGHIPVSHNLPILNNSEREEIGTLYKTQGKEAAIERGHQLVCGPTKSFRVEQWLSHLKNHPNSALYCFRGGLRSQTAQRWIHDAGAHVERLDGGYKKARQFFMQFSEDFSKQNKFIIVSGPTGSNKTQLLKTLAPTNYTCDLEGLALHKGSAFGALNIDQPSQSNFENLIAVSFILFKTSPNAENRSVLLEDESRLIGRRSIPEAMFLQMRESSVAYIEEPLAQRIENIFSDYILKSDLALNSESKAMAVFDYFEKATCAIAKKLGGVKTAEVLSLLKNSREQFFLKQDLEPNKEWIEQLLKHYYDPLYWGSLERRNPKILFKGTYKEVLSWFQNNKMTAMAEHKNANQV